MDDERAGRRSPLEAVRAHQWSAGERVVFISALAIVMGALFVTTYSLALGDPVPHRIDAAVIGDPAAHARTVSAVQQVADNSLLLHRYPSAAPALRAIDHQQVYAALDLATGRPTLYVASAAGVSVARLLERVSALDPEVRVVDTHPLDPHDPSGIDIFYLMLVATIVGFLTVFQLVAHAGSLSNRQWWLSIVLLAIVASLVFVLVEADPGTHRLARSRGMGHSGPAGPLRGILRAADDAADRPLGDPADVGLLRRARQQLQRRRGGPAAVAAPVRPRLAMASVGRDCHSAAKRRLLQRLPAGPSGTRAGRLVGGAVRRHDGGVEAFECDLMTTMRRPDAGHHRTAGESSRLGIAGEDAGEHGVDGLAGEAVVEWRVSVEQAVVEGAPEVVDRDFDVSVGGDLFRGR